MRIPYIEAGEIVTTHGVRGEVKVLTWLDSPEDLCSYRRCRIGGKDYIVEKCRVQKTCNLLKLKNVDTVEAGQALRGKTVELYREDAPEGLVFSAELMNMDVFADGEKIGEIVDVLDYPGNQVYIVKGQYEYMIPAVSAFVLSTSVEGNRMDVRIIEGMRSDEV